MFFLAWCAAGDARSQLQLGFFDGYGMFLAKGLNHIEKDEQVSEVGSRLAFCFVARVQQIL